MLSVFYLFALSLLELSWLFGFIGMVRASCSMVKLTVLLFGKQYLNDLFCVGRFSRGHSCCVLKKRETTR